MMLLLYSAGWSRDSHKLIARVRVWCVERAQHIGGAGQRLCLAPCEPPYDEACLGDWHWILQVGLRMVVRLFTRGRCDMHYAVCLLAGGRQPVLGDAGSDEREGMCARSQHFAARHAFCHFARDW